MAAANQWDPKQNAILANAYFELVKGLMEIMRPLISGLRERAKGDEPATEADKAVADVVGKLLELMENAQQTVTKDLGLDGNNLKNQ